MIKKKIKKLVQNPYLFFYDFFRKRCNISQNSDQQDNNIDIASLQRKIVFIEKLLNINSWNNSNFKSDFNCETWTYIANKKTIFRNNIWCAHYKNFFPNASPINPYELEKNFIDANCILLHGRGVNITMSQDISISIYNNMNIFYSEDGFLHSIVRPNDTDYDELYRIGLSLVVDSKGSYFAANRPSELEDMLNSDLELSEQQLERAQKNINFIKKNYISKYNNQPIKKISIGRTGTKKVLVVDQAVNDFSISLGGCTDSTFIEMLLAAIHENPDCDILVKVHPDMIQNPNRGGKGTRIYGHYTDFDFSKYKNVYIIAEYINPISLLEQVDKVYVVTSQMGFEALFCGKEVIIFGLPFYAGWGCGELRSTNSNIGRRKKKRTIQEIFYITYLKYVRYANPLTKQVCEIEEILSHILETRNRYMLEFNIENDIQINAKEYSNEQNSIINIAFATDYNFYKNTIVAILSLLESASSNTFYNIYCFHSNDLNNDARAEMHTYIKKYSNHAQIEFLNIDELISSGYECRGVSKMSYARLFIHRFIKDIDKIIYSDVDVIFNSDLSEVYNFNYGNHLMAACIDIGQNSNKLFSHHLQHFPYWKKYMGTLKGRYFSAGFLIINLRKIRESEIDKKWEELITEPFNYQDMDIINATINNYIFQIHSKYCIIPRALRLGIYEDGVKEKFIPKTHLEQIKSNVAIYHFAGIKPWDDKSVIGADIWWSFVKKYPELYSYFKFRYAQKKLLRLK